MRLTKLELSGFKSFAKKTELQFGEGITAIIGPNGSGKSNIADAIRWVLGEQSARILRGNRMDDVIFGGTASRKQQSYCEVTLTFDNTDGSLPIDYSEVSITRRIYRVGDSEYCINKTNCRLKDIQELFRDTGIGKEGYSIVGQNKVEEILSNKSGERRKALEEAAGIMKYRVRKEEACHKLENTKKNILRISDILYEIEERLDPLKEQSEAASEYLRLRDELRELEINLFLHQYDRISERLRLADEALSELSLQINALEKEKNEASQSCDDLEKKERAVSKEISELNTKLISTNAGLEAHIGEIKVLEERIANSGRERERLITRIADNKTRRSELEALLVTRSSDSICREEILNSLKNELQTSQTELIAINSEAADKEFELERLKDSIIEAANRLGDAKGRLSHLAAIRGTLVERLESIERGSSAIQAETEKLTQETEEAQEELSRLERDAATVSEKLASAINCANETNFNLNKQREAIRTLENGLESKRSRLKVLMEMKSAHEGYYSSIKNVLRDAESNDSLAVCIEGVVAEIIKVPKEFETAIEMTLGSALQNIVTPDTASAKRVIEHLRSNRYGRATLLPVSSVKPRTLAREELSLLNTEGCYGVASDLIEYESRYKNVADNLLGRTVIVRDLDVGIKLNRVAGQAFRIATLNGDIINPGGAMTGGSISKKEFSLLGRERECAELLSSIDADKKTLFVENEEAVRLVASLTEIEDTIQALTSEKHNAALAISKQRDKIDVMDQYAAKTISQFEDSVLERSRISDSISDIDRQTEEAKKLQAELSTDSASNQEEVRLMQSALNALRERQSAANDRLTELKVRVTALEKEGDALKEEQKRLSRELSAAIATIEYDEIAIEQYAVEMNEIQSQKSSLETALGEKREKSAEEHLECERLEAERKHLQAHLDTMRDMRESIESSLSEKREQHHKTELNRSKSESELATMQDKIWEDYELTYDNAQVYRRPIAVTAAHQRADELKKHIRGLGNVNVNAIEDYKDLSDRHDSMRAQCDDLERAETDLTELIDKLTATMEHDFSEKFEQIRENLKHVFSELFGGGTAELVLSDPNDILNCDIDILAQIPGKKLQRLAPLSGGERALTAIALLFAILTLKPTAFCLLDEIDASLDEVNVTNFANYIHSYAEQTQFILITHRKGSMESSNTLYGVAQEEKGVSKIVSAKISQPAAV